MKNERALGIWLEGQHVGSIVRVSPEKGDLSVFLLDESYLKDQNRPTLSLGFAGQNGTIHYTPQHINKRIHPYFSNLLPEGRLRSYIADNLKINAQREFYVLEALGEDLPGAVIVLPESAHPVSIAGNEMTLPVFQEGEPLKFSLAGVQIKMSAVQNARGGLTIPAYGRGGSWIVKLPSAHYEAVPENEFTMMRLANRLGLSVPENYLLPVSEVEGLPRGMRQSENLFAIKRFDRNAHGQRIHMEDFAQVFGLYPEQKYGKASYHNIAEVLLKTSGLSAVQDFIRRITFMVSIGNGDMHLKNWTLLYPDGRRPVLSPVYDMLSTLPYVSQRESMGLSFAKSKDFREFSSNRIARFAERLGLDPISLLMPAQRIAEDFPDAWSDAKRDAPMPIYMQDAIDKHLQDLPIFREAHPTLFEVQKNQNGEFTKEIVDQTSSTAHSFSRGEIHKQKQEVENMLNTAMADLSGYLEMPQVQYYIKGMNAGMSQQMLDKYMENAIYNDSILRHLENVIRSHIAQLSKADTQHADALAFYEKIKPFHYLGTEILAQYPGQASHSTTMKPNKS